MLVWGDEDLLSTGANSEEGHIVHWIDVTDDRTSLKSQIGDMVGNVLRRRRSRCLVSLGDNSALIVDDQ